MSPYRNYHHEETQSPLYQLEKPRSPRINGVIFALAVMVALGFRGISTELSAIILGAAFLAYGISQFRFTREHGWYGKLTDKYMMLVGTAWIFSAVYGFFVSNRIMHWVTGISLATLGIVVPVLRVLESAFLKSRCSESLDAECADIIERTLVSNDGSRRDMQIERCPIFRVWRGGGEEILCDELFANVKYVQGEHYSILVNPAHNTEIYEKQRAKNLLESSLLSWFVYDFVAAMILVMAYLIRN